MKMRVLDHGYVEFIEAWGHGKVNQIFDDYCPRVDMEPGIIEAARMSTQASFRDWTALSACDRCGAWTPATGDGGDKGDESCSHEWKKFPRGDEGLLSFLYNSKPAHAGPFEFAGMTMEIQCPLFVRSEHHRHRTQSYNEMSARYAPLPNLNYVPSVARLMMGGTHVTSNKQAQAAKGAGELTLAGALRFQETLSAHYADAETEYQRALTGGVPKELARAVIPVGRYTRFRASANLRNWLAFMTLRYDPAAQWEIQEFAKVIGNVIAEVFPRTWRLFTEKRSVESAKDRAWAALAPEDQQRYLEQA